MTCILFVVILTGLRSIHYVHCYVHVLVGKLQLATSKGLVAGDLQFTDADGNVVDCATYKAV